MMRSVKILGAATFGIALALVSAASAQTQTVHRHARHPAAEGRQITVYGRESYLTLGTAASPGDFNGYALNSISSTAPFNPGVDHTTVGVRGLNRLPNNFTVPGCCVP
jgi:hypothetical protein